MQKRRVPLNYSTLVHVLLVISLCLNIYLLIRFDSKNGEEQALGWQQLQEIWEPGTYGPSDMELVKGSLRISAAGVILQNIRVTDDLILTAAIGDGCVDLIRVVVDETVMVQGGGEDTVVFEDALINHLVIDREDGKVRVVLKGSTVVEKVTILGEAGLSTEELNDEGRVGELYIETAAEIELEGFFEDICVAKRKAKVSFLKGEVQRLRTGEEAEGTLIDLKEGVVVESLAAGAPLELSGEGTIKDITVSCAGLCKISGNVENLSAGGSELFLEVTAGSIARLVVEPSEDKLMIRLTEEVAVRYMEFNGAAEVSGGGLIERVKINVPGVVMEQKPVVVDLAEGIKAIVAGKEVIEEPPPPPKPVPAAPPPEPDNVYEPPPVDEPETPPNGGSGSGENGDSDQGDSSPGD